MLADTPHAWHHTKKSWTPATETFPDHVGGTNPGDAGYGIVAFEFDPMGRLQRRTDQLGDTVTMNYDLASRILQRDYRTRVNSPSGTIADSDVFTHDRMGRILSGVSGRYGNTVGMAYDDIGRPQSESLTISGQTYTTSYTHDAMNRRSGMTLPDGSVVLRTYTSRSQLHQAKLDGFTLDTRTYDAGGRHSTSTYGNGVVITHAYRTNGSLKDDLLASITTTHPGGIPSGQQVGNYSYTWDANRNKLSESITGILSGMGFTPVTYDNEERLTAWSRSDGNQGQTWSLSLVGDWNTHVQTGTVAFTQDRVHGPAHEFNSFTGTASGTLTFDSKGNNTARPATLASPALNLTWDFGNQLSGVDTNGTPASQEVTFRYDVLGRRVGRVEGGSSIVFVQAGQQTVADYDAGQIPSKPNHIYVYGSYIDEPIARRESGSLAYFHRNQQYSIIALSNSSGAVIERYSYTAHGQPTIFNAAGTVLSASAFDNRFTYTGREWDSALALHYFRARWYDPLAGRFISRDPLGYVDGMNLYRGYLSVSGVDPFGLAFYECQCTCFHWSCGGTGGGSGNSTCVKKEFEAPDGTPYMTLKSFCEEICDDSETTSTSGTGIASGTSCTGKLTGDAAFCELMRSMCSNLPPDERFRCESEADAYCKCIWEAHKDIARRGGPGRDEWGQGCTDCRDRIHSFCKNVGKEYFLLDDEEVHGGIGRTFDYIGAITGGRLGTDGHQWVRIVYRHRYAGTHGVGSKVFPITVATIDFWGDFDDWWGEGRNSCRYVDNQGLDFQFEQGIKGMWQGQTK